MPTFTATKTYKDGSTLFQSDLDGLAVSMETFLNTTKLDSSNIQNGGIASANLSASSVTSSAIAANAVTTAAITDANVTTAKLATVTQQFLVPTGGIVEFAGAAAPTGWLICDGSAVSRATYSTLFSAIGTIWGSGDGSTTFNIPDRRGRVGVGAGTGSGLTSRSLAATGGEETHTLVTSEVPSHTHDVWVPSGSGGSDTELQVVSPGQTGHYVTNATSGNPYTKSVGGDGAHNNMQPFAVFNYIIKT